MKWHPRAKGVLHVVAIAKRKCSHLSKPNFGGAVMQEMLVQTFLFQCHQNFLPPPPPLLKPRVLETTELVCRHGGFVHQWRGARPIFFLVPWFSPNVYVKKSKYLQRVLSVTLPPSRPFSCIACLVSHPPIFLSCFSFYPSKKLRASFKRLFNGTFFLAYLAVLCTFFFSHFKLCHCFSWGSCSSLELSGHPSGAKLGVIFRSVCRVVFVPAFIIKVELTHICRSELFEFMAESC